MRWKEKRSKQWEQLGQRQGLAIAQHGRRTSFVAGNGTKSQKIKPVMPKCLTLILKMTGNYEVILFLNRSDGVIFPYCSSVQKTI